MAQTFPNSPSTGTVYTVNNTSWKYDGSGWIRTTLSTAIPGQTGNSGKYLTTDGSNISWSAVTALPSQTGNSGKYLITDGTTSSWSAVTALPSQTGNSGKYLITDGTTSSWSTLSITAFNNQQNTGTGALGLPVGTTAERPASPANGYVRYNTTTGFGEIYNATSAKWLTFGTNPDYTVEYIVVAGGGGGGRGEGNPTGDGAGGGGAGGFRTGSMVLASSVLYSITVGGYGAGSTDPALRGSNGSDSVFYTITATGGGGGGSDANPSSNANGANGGSGGGAAASYPLANYSGGISSPVTSPVQGYAGGSGTNSNRNGCGGGGAGGAGGDSNSLAGGSGTSAYSSFLSDAAAGVNVASTGTYYIAAGGGGGATNSASGGAGGNGGGGVGGGNSGAVGAGGTNTGSGGGGGGGSANVNGGNGGNGIVILRYSSTLPAASITTGSPTITSVNGYRYYKWTGNGTITL